MKLMELFVLRVRGGVVTKICISCLFVFFGAGFGKCQSWQASRWAANPEIISNNINNSMLRIFYNQHFQLLFFINTHEISKPTSPLPPPPISGLPLRPCSIVDKPDPSAGSDSAKGKLQESFEVQLHECDVRHLANTLWSFAKLSCDLVILVVNTPLVSEFL